MVELAAQRYGTALFELAVENNQVDEMLNEVMHLKDIISEETDFLELISNPKISMDDRKQVIENIFEGRISDYIIGLIDLVIKKNRQSLLLQIFEDFITKINEHKGVVIATVTVCEPLTQVQEEALTKRLETLTKKTISLQQEFDKSLVGGIVIRIGDRIMNYSVKGMLNAMSKEILNS